MTVGYPVNKAVIDSRAGYLVKTLRDVFDGIQTLKGVLDGLTTDQLVAMGYVENVGTGVTEVSWLKSGITDLAALAAVANGQQAQTPANDFFFWADRLTGVE